jgi:signal transduction histidine kinase
LTITLADDGKGFDPHAVGGDGHFGLVIMQDRAREIDARLTLTSHPGGGTQVVLHLPLDPNPRPALYAMAREEGVNHESAHR